MRLLLFSFFFLSLCNQALSQKEYEKNKSKKHFPRVTPSLFVLAYSDTPFDITETNGVDLKGGSLMPQRNIGQLYAVEANSQIFPKLGFLVGGGIGFTKLKLQYSTSPNFLTMPSSVDFIEDAKLNAFAYITGYAGVSYLINFNNNFYCRANFRYGILAPDRIIHYFERINEVNNQSFQFISGDLDVNRSRDFYTMIMPEINLGYTFQKVPMFITVGFASFFVPKSYINGRITLYGTNENHRATVSHNVKAIGFTVGLHIDVI